MRPLAARSLPLALSLAATLAACSHSGAQEHTAARSAVVDARGATLVRVHARAGTLRIEGRPGLQQVRVSGTARANERKYLEGIRLVTDRRGDEVDVRVEIPEVRVMFGSVQRALDLVVEVPEGVEMDVADSSGDAEIRRVGALRLKDSSGDLEIDDVRGDLRVEDSSGDVSVRRAAGEVWLRDSSGDLRVREVGGEVIVDRDGSGDIDVSGIRGSVVVHEDGSGEIRASDVGGDFTVGRDGSGGVRVSRVAGRVRIPQR